jgi:Ni,Fe-hydrogenase maturation factor
LIVLKLRNDSGFLPNTSSSLISIYQGGPMPILKLEKDDENKEVEFELCYLKSLTTKERFLLMQKKSDEMKKMLAKHGYRKSTEIVKRT